MASFGNGILTNALYDTIKSLIMSSNTKEELAKKIDIALHLHNVNVNAESIITLLASNGFITIEDYHIKSNLSITMGSFNNGELLFGNNSKSETNKTSIDAGFNSFIKMSGNAKIVQHEDGSIRFYT